MHSGQTILTIAAIMLMVLAILNFNRTLIDVGDMLDQDRFRLEALSMLTSYIEHTSQYYYDEASKDTSNEKTLNDFTLPNALGLEANDSSVVDDFDDFNNLTIADIGRSGIQYNINFKVEYVRLNAAAIVISGVREFHKRMTINITDSYSPPLIYDPLNPAVRDTIRMSFVYSYWFYN